MAIRPQRVLGWALAFLLAACSAQVAAPRPSDTPETTAAPTATATPTNNASEILYVRSITTGGEGNILVVDARTGAIRRTFADGAVSTDGTTLYWPERVNGATTTLVHVVELSTGDEKRAFPVAGDLRPFAFNGSATDVLGARLSPDSRYVVLTNPPYKTGDEWVTKLVVADTSTGAILGSSELHSLSTFGILALSPDARSLFVDQYGEGSTRTRILDVRSGALRDVAGTAATQQGFRTPGVLSRDGRWLYRLDAGDQLGYADTDTPFVLAVDLVAGRAVRIALPIEQKTWDFEKYMLWSVAQSRDGRSLLAVNAALGVIDEIDLATFALTRTRAITVSRAEPGAFASLVDRFFGSAEAKRYVIGGAVLSPDGRTLYGAGHDGIVVIDTGTLASRGVWQAKDQYDALFISPGGERLYGVNNSASRVTITDTSSGAQVGLLKLPGYIPAIVRVDAAR